MKVVIPQITWHTRDPVLALDFDPRGKSEQGYYRIASGGADKLLLIWHLSDPESVKPEIICVSELKRHQKAVNVCRFSPCGNYLASGDDDSYIFIWKNEGISDTEEVWSVEKIFRRHVEDVSDLCWSPDGNYLVSGSVDNTAVLWDVKKGSVLHFWSEREHTGFVQGVAYDPLGEVCATMCIDRNLRFFKTKEGKLVHKTVKYPMAWLGTSEEDETKENKPNNNEGIESSKPMNPILEFNRIQAESPEENEKPLSEVNGKSEDDSKLPPKKPVTTLNRLFHDDTLKTFCRRLSFSPRGELLLVPGGLLPPVEKKKEESRQSTPVDGEDSKEKGAKKFDPEQNNAVIVFCRNSWTNPCAIIPTGVSFSIAARFNPIYYDRERVPYEYGPDLINSTKKCERIVSCVCKLRPPGKESNVLLDMPYRLVYAVATNDSILIGDTASTEPLAIIRNIHCTRMTDLSWSPDGLLLIASSTDGYCSIITFKDGELGVQFKADEFPALTATCFPIAPPSPKILKKREPKELKEVKEKKDKEVSTPVDTKVEKRKKPLTLPKMLSGKTSANHSVTPAGRISLSVDKDPIPDIKLNLTQSTSVVGMCCSDSLTIESPPSVGATKTKPTLLDSWIKKTPKSCAEVKQPRRIQLVTLSSSSIPVSSNSKFETSAPDIQSDNKSDNLK